MMNTVGSIYIGTSGWKKAQWRGGFYPTGLVQRRELEFASRQLTSLEINSTFHGLQAASSFATWRAETPEHFVFAVKGLEAATRFRAFRGARLNLSNFFASGVLTLGEKLGPLLWQLPSTVQFHRGSLADFLDLLPRTVVDAANLAREANPEFSSATEHTNYRLRHAIEVRDRSFLNETFIELLTAREIAVVFTNAPASPGFRQLTSDFVYVRLSSGEDHYASGYDDASLREWADRIREWASGPSPRDVFAYFKNPAGLLPYTPLNAVRLIRLLEGDSPAGVSDSHTG